MGTVGGVPVQVGQWYRARLLIKAPKMLAGESRIRSELQGEGFDQIRFYEQKALPADWPADQREDPSNWGSWTAFLEGVYAREASSPAGEEKPVQLLGLWPVGAPQPGGQPEPVAPEAPPAQPAGEPSSPMLWVAGGIVGAYLLTRQLLKSVR